jgi:hypothetical protein
LLIELSDGVVPEHPRQGALGARDKRPLGVVHQDLECLPDRPRVVDGHGHCVAPVAQAVGKTAHRHDDERQERDVRDRRSIR